MGIFAKSPDKLQMQAKLISLGMKDSVAGLLTADMFTLKDLLNKGAEGNAKKLLVAIQMYTNMLSDATYQNHPGAITEINAVFREISSKIDTAAVKSKNPDFVEGAFSYFTKLYQNDPESNNASTLNTIMQITEHYDKMFYPSKPEEYVKKADLLADVYKFKLRERINAPIEDAMHIASCFELAIKKTEDPKERAFLMNKTALVYAMQGDFVGFKFADAELDQQLDKKIKTPRVDAWKFVGEELEKENNNVLAIKAYEHALAVVDTVPSAQYREDVGADIKKNIKRLKELNG